MDAGQGVQMTDGPVAPPPPATMHRIYEFAFPTPQKDYTNGTLDPARAFGQRVAASVHEVNMQGIYTDEDMKRWFMNFLARHNPYTDPLATDVKMLRNLAVVAAEFPDIICRHWDNNALLTAVAELGSGRRLPRTDLVTVRSLQEEMHSVAELMQTVTQAMQYATPMSYSASENEARKRARDTNLVTASTLARY